MKECYMKKRLPEILGLVALVVGLMADLLAVIHLVNWLLSLGCCTP
jgi:hypothetical protein